MPAGYYGIHLFLLGRFAKLGLHVKRETKLGGNCPRRGRATKQFFLRRASTSQLRQAALESTTAFQPQIVPACIAMLRVPNREA